MSDGETSFSGKVSRTFCNRDNFAAGIFRADSGREFKFSCFMKINEDSPIVIYGNWHDDPKFGPQFKIALFQKNSSMSKEVLQEYLMNSHLLVGIGPVKAEKIANKFWVDFEDTLINKTHLIADEAGVKESVFDLMKSEWIRNKATQKEIFYLVGLGIDMSDAEKIVSHLGSKTQSVVSQDPYRILSICPRIGFSRLDEIVMKADLVRFDDHRRVGAAAQSCLKDLADEGHCWMEYEDLNKFVSKKIGHRVSLENYPELDNMNEDGTCRRSDLFYLLGEGQLELDKIALTSLVRAEHRIHQIFDDSEFDSSETKNISYTMDLNDKQRLAYDRFFNEKVSVITGGAGCGKSYTISKINEDCLKAGLVVLLLAPTGKAAKRLKELTGSEASTIHRALGYNGVGFLRDENTPLICDVIIIDEFSMVNSYLASSLFRATPPNARILIVGDHMQLPPIGPGNPMRDLILSGGAGVARMKNVTVTVLDHVIRQTGILKSNCTKIAMEGVVEDSSPGEEWNVITDAEGNSDVIKKIMDIVEKEMGSLDKKEDILSRVQILSPMKKGELGTIELNRILQGFFQDKIHGKRIDTDRGRKGPKFFVGDKVIQIKNDYDKNVMNGTLGTVTFVDSDGAFYVRFEDGEKEILYKAGCKTQNDVQLGYALTIHKVQGSEFPVSIVIVDNSQWIMLKRNLLYTGVTRSKERTYLIGQKSAIARCASNNVEDKRRSFLKDWLENGVPEFVEEYIEEIKGVSENYESED